MKRLGWFEVHQDIIKSQPETVRQIMGECIVIRAEARYDRGAIEYIALSDKFDEVPLGGITPKYDIVLTKLKKGVKINWRKEKT